ncbi:hypothetical protein [Shimia sagamensis]|uniref:Uncharacterized protein n=1 Tax=Shimia sagamensis TaxID=1566352 RepID=A0ABY1PG41_9RHOB|nr:hypothetical protein [Shimia sagamensis]SMP32153.1 hypothetical protein SAMN06265373_108138 [Shimia sagamensis]
MFIKVKSSRDTSAGLFRAGLVYDLRKADAKTLDAVKPHLTDGGPFKKLSAKAAEKASKESVVTLGPSDEVTGGDAPDMPLATDETAGDDTLGSTFSEEEVSGGDASDGSVSEGDQS